MSDAWTLLLTVETEEEAQVIAGFLDSQGVPCRLDNAHSHEFPVNVGVLGEVRLLVPEERATEARALLAERESSAEAVPE